MYLRMHLIVLTQLMLQPPCKSSKDDLTALLPDLTRLCPGLDFCGLDHGLDDNVTLEMKSCCFGCSCDENCDEKHDCCFPNLDPEQSIYKCLAPATNQNLKNVQKYRFVVKEPSGGCLAPSNKVPGDNVTCSPDEQAAPWGNFLPVYSKTLNKNFKNAACGRCHGADELLEWGSMFEFTGGTFEFADSMTLFNEKNMFFKSHVNYVPPNAESKDSEQQCFDEKDTCSLYFKDIFYIPSSLQMDRQSIIEACESGPHARYVRNINKAYKNVFCAICDAASFAFIDDVRCEYTGDVKRTSGSPYRTLIDSKHMDNSKLDDNKEKTEEVPCYKPKHHKNASRCAELHCPLLQTRLNTGSCGYRTTISEIQCLKLCLTLTATSNTEEDIALLRKMTSTEVHGILEDNSPWSAAWTIDVITYLIESENLEIYVCMNLKSKQVSLRSLMRYTMKQLAKAWHINIGRQLKFNQEIFKHGQTPGNGTYNLAFPRWSTFKSSSSLNLTSPIWKILFQEQNVGGKPYRSCVPITQMMICEQVALPPDEYSLEDPNAALHLINEDKILYPNEFTALADSDDGFQVRVCLKDSGYVKMGHTNGAGYLRPVFILSWTLVLMDRIMTAYATRMFWPQTF